MNIYIISCPHADYDEYQAWVVIADTQDAALQLIRDSDPRDEDDPGSMLPPPKYLTPEYLDIEPLGTSPETAPRIAYADFRAG